ncbi:MAG: signal peptidase I [Bacteroidales bacterium]|nr:signal peptidase I [Bacteroidales bacterium]
MNNAPRDAYIKFYLTLILLAGILVLFIVWTGWLKPVGLIGLLLVMAVFPEKTKKIPSVIRSNYWFKTPLYLILAFLLAIFFRVFVAEVYTIPSSSMEQTLLPGDKVLVSKLRYGPYLPASLKEVPWLNVFYSGNNQKQSKYRETGRRLKVCGQFQRNDVIVFKHPQSHQAYIKRCVGLPGDSLRLRGETLYANGKQVQLPPTLKHDYLIDTQAKEKLKSWMKNQNASLKILPKEKMKANLTLAAKTKLRALPWLDSLVLMTDSVKNHVYERKDRPNYRILQREGRSGLIYGDSLNTGWKDFSFGPLYIPKEGATIRLNEKNLELYRHTIERHEGHQIKQNKEQILIDGNKRDHYRFTRNYYFMLGDNRCHSSDSRSWGFVPESHIIGKAEFILFSNWHGKVKWKRFFKGIK